MQTFDRITKKIQTSLSLLQNAQDNPYLTQTQQIKSKFDSVEQNIINTSNDNETDPEQTRKHISSIRKEINDLLEQTDQILSLSADDYRNKILSEKEAFESLTNKEQKSANPQAFQSKQIFHTFENLIEQIRQMNTALMSWSGQLEHNKLEAQIGPEILSNPENPEISRPTLSP
jgi:ElaB/YqjD/DUF883 family membrane-anchored ribosome-binding protein